MIDITTEHLLDFRQASRLLPSNPHKSTLHRWSLRGINRIRLETCKVGGRRLTSLEAISRFVAATTAAADGNPPVTCTPSQRQRAIDQAARELRDAGV
jgi:hypothetical protein